jgi:hypothetical protein
MLAIPSLSGDAHHHGLAVIIYTGHHVAGQMNVEVVR